MKRGGDDEPELKGRKMGADWIQGKYFKQRKGRKDDNKVRA